MIVLRGTVHRSISLVMWLPTDLSRTGQNKVGVFAEKRRRLTRSRSRSLRLRDPAQDPRKEKSWESFSPGHGETRAKRALPERRTGRSDQQHPEGGPEYARWRHLVPWRPRRGCREPCFLKNVTEPGKTSIFWPFYMIYHKGLRQ